jgi:carotenoid cleavage dioxygenase-like enzyme
MLMIGLYDFNGNLPSPTFTAHPKVDAQTGNIYAYGYEAKGDSTTGISSIDMNNTRHLFLCI